MRTIDHAVSPWWALAPLVMVYAGAFKGTALLSWLPVDLTLLAVGLTLTGCAVALSRNGWMLPRHFWWFVFLWLSFIPGLVIAVLLGHPLTKSLLLFSLVFLAVLAPPLLIASKAAIRVWLGGHVCAALVAYVGLRLFPDAESVQEFGRSSVAGSTTILISQVVGAAAAVLFVHAMAGGRRRLISLAGGIGCVMLVLDIGSRGPFIALLVALGVSSLVLARRRRVGLTFVAATVIGGIVLYVLNSSDRAARRLARLLDGTDLADEGRLDLYAIALDIIVKRPQGIGWDGFRLWQHPALGVGLGDYPHNTILEVAAEGGWIAGLALIGVIIGCFRKATKHVRTFHGLCVVTLLVFWVVSAQFSSDVTGNRMMWAALSLGAFLSFADKINAGRPDAEVVRSARSGRGKQLGFKTEPQS